MGFYELGGLGRISRYFSFLPQHKNMHIRITGDSKLSLVWVVARMVVLFISTWGCDGLVTYLTQRTLKIDTHVSSTRHRGPGKDDKWMVWLVTSYSSCRVAHVNTSHCSWFGSSFYRPFKKLLQLEVSDKELQADTL